MSRRKNRRHSAAATLLTAVLAMASGSFGTVLPGPALGATAPTVSGVSPRYGPPGGGTYSNVAASAVNPHGTITIAGSGFTGASAVLFDQSKNVVRVAIATSQVNGSGTQITGVVPPADSEAEGVSIQVVTPDGTSARDCAVLQKGCKDGYFYLKAKQYPSVNVPLDSLSNTDYSFTPTDGPDEAPGGVVHECGYKNPPSPGPAFSGSVAFGSTQGTTLTGRAAWDQADNASIPTAFLGNFTLTLNRPIQITVALTGSYGDCIEVQTPLTFLDLVGIDVVLEPGVSANVSDTLTMMPGTYTIGAGWVNGRIADGRHLTGAPGLTLNCPGTSACIQSSPLSIGAHASLVAGPMIRIGPAVGDKGAYVEAGPAVGLAAGTGSEGTYAEACAGGIWDGHVNLPGGINFGAGGPLLGPYQLAGAGDGYPSQQCPLGPAQVPMPSVSSISPAGGSGNGGTEVTVYGNNFGYDSTVMFGSAPGTDVNVDPLGTKLTAVSPAGSGSVDVRVADQAGVSSAAPPDVFTYSPADLNFSWTETPLSGTPPGGAFYGNLACVSGSECWVSGVTAANPYAVWSTFNGGAGWSEAILPDSGRGPECGWGGQASQCMVAADAQDIYVAGYTGQSAAFWASHDSGAGWTKYAIPDPTFSNFALACPGPATCYLAAGQNDFFETTTGGSSWTKLTTNLGSVAAGGAPSLLVCYSLSGCILSDGGSMLAVTTDGGVTWTAENEGATALYCLDAKDCFLGDPSGVAYSPDGGFTWYQSAIATSGNPVTSVSCASGKACLASTASAAFITVDGGKSWQNVTPPDSCGCSYLPEIGAVYLTSPAGPAYVMGVDGYSGYNVAWKGTALSQE